MNLLPHVNLVLAVAALISPQLVLVEAKGITLSAPLEELPVKTGNVMGDSHFELWSGEWYGKYRTGHSSWFAVANNKDLSFDE